MQEKFELLRRVISNKSEIDCCLAKPNDIRRHRGWNPGASRARGKLDDDNWNTYAKVAGFGVFVFGVFQVCDKSYRLLGIYGSQRPIGL